MSESRNIIIVGASRGLGRAMVETAMLNYPQANVTAIARSQNELNSLASSFEESRLHIVCGDITDTATMEAAIDGTLAKWGSIDGVIFNAGLLAPVQHLYDQNYDMAGAKRLFDVNYFSIVQFTNLLLNKLGLTPQLESKETKLNIVFVSTGASTRPCDGWLAYGTSKASVNMMCTYLNQEMYPIVRSVSVAPGIVDTEMQADIREKYKDVIIPSAHQKYVDLYKSGKLLKPHDVASIYCRLMFEGIPHQVDGKYVRWNEIFTSS